MAVSQKTTVKIKGKPDAIKLIEWRQKHCATVDRKYRLIIRENLVFAKEFVLELWQSKELFDRFMAHSFWVEKPYQLNRDRLPLLSMQFILGVQKAEGAAYERARTHAKIIEYYLKKNSSSSAMLEDLMKSSLTQVLARLSNSVAEKNLSSNPDKASRVTALGIADQIEGGTIEPEKEARSKRQQTYPFNSETEIAIEMSKKDRNSLLNIALGEVKYVTIRRVTNDGHWVKLRAVVNGRRLSR